MALLYEHPCPGCSRPVRFDVTFTPSTAPDGLHLHPHVSARPGEEFRHAGCFGPNGGEPVPVPMAA